MWSFLAGGYKDLHVVGVRPQPARCVSVGVNKDWISSCTVGDVKVGTVIAATWDEKVPYIQDTLTLQTVPNNYGP